MIEVAVYLAIVLAIAGLGVWVGMIVAGRIDRHMPRSDEPPRTPPEPMPAPPETQEEQS